MINYVGLDEFSIEKILEVSSSHKLNKYVPGTQIQVVDEKCLYSEQPEYVILFSWHIAEELIPILKNKGYLGKFIIPLPDPVILN